MMKGQKGITLVALIITIVVMLILVAVTLTIALNPDNGIVGKAKEAQNGLNAAQDKETTLLNGDEAKTGINNLVNGGGMNITTNTAQ